MGRLLSLKIVIIAIIILSNSLVAKATGIPDNGIGGTVTEDEIKVILKDKNKHLKTENHKLKMDILKSKSLRTKESKTYA